jgi:hypothetical protein
MPELWNRYLPAEHGTIATGTTTILLFWLRLRVWFSTSHWMHVFNIGRVQWNLTIVPTRWQR